MNKKRVILFTGKKSSGLSDSDKNDLEKMRGMSIPIISATRGTGGMRLTYLGDNTFRMNFYRGSYFGAVHDDVYWVYSCMGGFGNGTTFLDYMPTGRWFKLSQGNQNYEFYIDNFPLHGGASLSWNGEGSTMYIYDAGYDTWVHVREASTQNPPSSGLNFPTFTMDSYLLYRIDKIGITPTWTQLYD